MAFDTNVDGTSGPLTEAELIDQLFIEAHSTLKQITVIVDELNSNLASLQQRIECGEFRRDVEAETLRWLAAIQEQCLTLIRQNL